MRSGIPAIFILFAGYTYSQDTLRDVTAFMYSLNYFLFPDGRFESKFVHCTGITYGQGQYKKKWNSIVFSFDSIPVPETTYQCSFDESADSIQLTVLSAHDSSSGFAVVIQNDKSYITDDEGGKLTLPSSADSIQLRCLGEPLFIHPSRDECNTYTIYISEPFITYERPCELILKRRKRTKDEYYQVYINWDENPEKPWKKGTKRKGAYNYLLIPGN